MTGFRSILLAATLATAGGVQACGDPATLAATFIFITNTWEDVNDPGHTFGLNSQDDGETAGQFTGTEFVSVNDNVGFPMTGSWAEGRISFTVQRATGAVTYSGVMPTDGLNELTFTSPAGQLRIRRQ
ncbi:MAG: hypothetical protein L0271_24535 [Gemmatimonadetes bacterium]|nr:hypothetical protein [Gemmatimonadota bacterium]